MPKRISERHSKRQEAQHGEKRFCSENHQIKMANTTNIDFLSLMSRSGDKLNHGLKEDVAVSCKESH